MSSFTLVSKHARARVPSSRYGKPKRRKAKGRRSEPRTTCPHCRCSIKMNRLASHIADRCPAAPLTAGRVTRTERKQSQKVRLYTRRDLGKWKRMVARRPSGGPTPVPAY